jgi:hypothetical protein
MSQPEAGEIRRKSHQNILRMTGRQSDDFNHHQLFPWRFQWHGSRMFREGELPDLKPVIA